MTSVSYRPRLPTLSSVAFNLESIQLTVEAGHPSIQARVPSASRLIPQRTTSVPNSQLARPMNAAEQELDNLIFVTSLQAPALQCHSRSPVTKNSAPAADSSCHHKCSANPWRTQLEKHPLDHTRHPHTPRTSGHHQPLAQDAPAHHPPRNHATRRTRHVDHQCP